MLAEGTEEATDATPSRWHAEWCVSFGPAEEPTVPDTEDVRRWHGPTRTLVIDRLAGSDLQVAEDARGIVLFAGVLTNAPELSNGRSGLDRAARIVLERFRAEGEHAFAALRGPFAALVWDRETERLIVARDQVGIEPIFYARHESTWYFSPSPDVLVKQPGVSAEPDAVALSEWLCGWFPAVEDTSYRDVKRVPPATVVTVHGADASLRRYWDPWPESEPIAWLEEQDLEAFDPLLQRAVQRTMNVGAPAIFLSGGVDSIAVAATATDVAAAGGSAAPVALSLTFPDARSSEEPIQKGVARHLGIDQELIPLTEAAGPDGLIAGSLALTAGWPQPMWNVWTPAYMRLARRAADRGRRLVLTGRGGDEWLTISPYLLADQVRRGDLVGAWRLIQMRRRSNGLKGPREIARLLWLTAGRSLGSAAMATIAPARWHERRRRRLLSERPAWVAPDPAIRQAMDARIERWMDPARPPQGFYVREARTAVRHPAITHDMEETQEFGRRVGVRMLHPFWDIDLISMLYRVPPELLMGDGRSKWLLRRRLASRVPGLGLETRGKVSAGHVFRGIVERESPGAWKRLGGPRALARIGAVGVEGIESLGHPQALVEQWGGPGRLWTLLNLETWVRQRQ
jgi:asparagine synthase (glutamine-hydrolysing)